MEMTFLRVLGLLLLFAQPRVSWGFPATTGKPTRVVVTGAGSSVGLALFKKLVAKTGKFEPIALVRTEQARRELLALPGVTPAQVRVGDITDKESIHGLFQGATKAVLCTSATPARSLGYRVKNFFRSLAGRTRAPRLAELSYPKGQDPYHVDFLGQRNVVDECVREGVEHIVLLSNMGGCRGDSKVNLIGRVEGDAHSGNLLKWKVTAASISILLCFSVPLSFSPSSFFSYSLRLSLSTHIAPSLNLPSPSLPHLRTPSPPHHLPPPHSPPPRPPLTHTPLVPPSAPRSAT